MGGRPAVNAFEEEKVMRESQRRRVQRHLCLFLAGPQVQSHRGPLELWN